MPDAALLVLVPGEERERRGIGDVVARTVQCQHMHVGRGRGGGGFGLLARGGVFSDRRAQLDGATIAIEARQSGIFFGFIPRGVELEMFFFT